MRERNRPSGAVDDSALVHKVPDAGVRKVPVPGVSTATEVGKVVAASRFEYDGEPGTRIRTVLRVRRVHEPAVVETTSGMREGWTEEYIPAQGLLESHFDSISDAREPVDSAYRLLGLGNGFGAVRRLSRKPTRRSPVEDGRPRRFGPRGRFFSITK